MECRSASAPPHKPNTSTGTKRAATTSPTGEPAVGDLQRQPDLGDLVHPRADRRHELAEEEQPEVAHLRAANRAATAAPVVCDLTRNHGSSTRRSPRRQGHVGERHTRGTVRVRRTELSRRCRASCACLGPTPARTRGHAPPGSGTRRAMPRLVVASCVLDFDADHADRCRRRRRHLIEVLQRGEGREHRVALQPVVLRAALGDLHDERGSGADRRR